MRVVRAADRPVKGVLVAHRVKCKYTAHLRLVLAGLVREGLLVSTPRGYWLAGKTIPEESD